MAINKLKGGDVTHSPNHTKFSTYKDIFFKLFNLKQYNLLSIYVNGIYKLLACILISFC
jgi:hypothetical protein